MPPLRASPLDPSAPNRHNRPRPPAPHRVPVLPRFTAPPLPLAQAEGRGLDLRELLDAGGVVGLLILALSVAMVALICGQLLALRRGALMPRGLAEQVHDLITQGRQAEATELARTRGGFLGRLLTAGLAEVPFGHAAVEKGVEDAAAERAARMYRRVEYLSVIGTIAPMLGLLGTVWGMIVAFMEFEAKANPQVSELAPGIYKALVTTLLGLGVAVPAVAGFALLRSRVDELVAEATLLAGHVFQSLKQRPPRTAGRRGPSRAAATGSAPPSLTATGTDG